MEALFDLDSLCPNCGNFVKELDDVTGFCLKCSGVGSVNAKGPTPIDKAEKLELWLAQNADTIEDLMLADNVTAKFAIREILHSERPRCMTCNSEMPHTTSGRHMFCTKKPECRRARRYYRYLIYEKHTSKEAALKLTLERYVTVSQ